MGLKTGAGGRLLCGFHIELNQMSDYQLLHRNPEVHGVSYCCWIIIGHCIWSSIFLATCVWSTNRQHEKLRAVQRGHTEVTNTTARWGILSSQMWLCDSRTRCYTQRTVTEMPLLNTEQIHGTLKNISSGKKRPRRRSRNIAKLRQ